MREEQIGPNGRRYLWTDTFEVMPGLVARVWEKGCTGRTRSPPVSPAASAQCRETPSWFRTDGEPRVTAGCSGRAGILLRLPCVVLVESFCRRPRSARRNDSNWGYRWGYFVLRPGAESAYIKLLQFSGESLLRYQPQRAEILGFRPGRRRYLPLDELQSIRENSGGFLRVCVASPGLDATRSAHDHAGSWVRSASTASDQIPSQLRCIQVGLAMSVGGRANDDSRTEKWIGGGGNFPSSRLPKDIP